MHTSVAKHAHNENDGSQTRGQICLLCSVIRDVECMLKKAGFHLRYMMRSPVDSLIHPRHSAISLPLSLVSMVS
jgi:hypothetical protein